MVSPVISSITPLGRGSAARGQIPTSSPISIARTWKPYRLPIATEIRKSHRRSIARVIVTLTTSPVVSAPAPTVRGVGPIRTMSVTPMGPAPTRLFISQSIANNPSCHDCKSRSLWGKNIYRPTGGIIHCRTARGQHSSNCCNQEESMGAFHHTPWTSAGPIIFRQFLPVSGRKRTNYSPPLLEDPLV